MAKIYFRKKVLLAKIEVTHGTDSAPTGAANAIQTRDLTISPLEADIIDLGLDKPNFGSNLATLVGQHVMITFKVPLAGSGAPGTAPAWGPLVRGTGATESIAAGVSAAYVPLDDDPPSLTMWVKIDGVTQKIKYCLGSWKLTTDKKNYPWLEFSFIGLWSAPIASPVITPVYTPWIRPVPFRATTVSAQLLGQTVGLFSLSVDGGQKVEFYEHSEEESVQITDRLSTFQAEFEEPTPAVHNFIADAGAETLGALEYVHGITAGNIVTIASPQIQFTKISRGNQQGINTLQVSGPLTTDGTDPDWTITCT